jgi:hypothetical protein
MTGKKASILVSCMILVFAIAGCGPSARGGGAAEPTGTPEAGAPEEEGEGEGEAVSDLDTPLACPVSVEDMDEGPVIWAEGTGGDRWMIQQTAVAEVKSSRARPVEVCGFGGQMAWLIKLTCPDGSSPYADADEAAKARTGSAGLGGRCETPLDRYVIVCPDGEYEIFMDLYHCLPGESFK